MNKNNKFCNRLLGSTAKVQLIFTTVITSSFCYSGFEAHASLRGQDFSIIFETTETLNAPQDVEEHSRADTAHFETQLKGTEVNRYLAITVEDERIHYANGETITFSAKLNYSKFINRAEVIIREPNGVFTREHAVLPLTANYEASWKIPTSNSAQYSYSVRVYDAEGRYDETAPQTISISDEVARTKTNNNTENTVNQQSTTDQTWRRGIPLIGGMLVVSGQVDPDSPLNIMGETVLVEPSGDFLYSRNLPAGNYEVEIKYVSSGQQRYKTLPVEIPRSEWHGVGIIDVTASHSLQNTASEADPLFEKTKTEGRVAYYIKGKTKGGWTITSSADTGEGDLETIFRRLDEKNPDAYLDRLKSDDLYPTYGDDSTSYDDTPSSGRVYVKAERGGTSALWGDFKTAGNNTQLLDSSRSLYGAEFRSESADRTAGGKPRATISAYGAKPDTLPQTDVLRGTGGSVLFLSHQDINVGSETVYIETVDPDTGRKVATQPLTASTDYEINYTQGIIKLAKPLNSSSSDGSLVSGAAGAYDVNLVVRYEYTPSFSDVEGYSYGARAEGWLSDNVRIGATGMVETTGAADQKMGGADLTVKLGEVSHITAEVAGSHGPGFGLAQSTDGGLSITEQLSKSRGTAMAYKLDSQLDLQELGISQSGLVNLYMESAEAGFSTLSRNIEKDEVLIGGRLQTKLSERLSAGVEAESYRQKGGERKQSVAADFAYALNQKWNLEGAANYLKADKLKDASKSGERQDVSARATRLYDEDSKLWLFGQATVFRRGGLERADRLGVGAQTRLSEKLLVSGDVSGGSSGLGASALLNYQQAQDREFYMGYTLDPTRTLDSYKLVGTDMGKLVLGSNYRYSEAANAFAENTFDLFGKRQSQTRAAGLTYTPSQRWSYSGAIESGRVRDRNNGDFDRDAISLGVAFSDEEALSAHVKGEYRYEDGTSGTVDTWALISGFEYKQSEASRFIGSVDALFSNNNQSTIADGDYAKASLGYAFRPIEDERLNVLFKYTYLHDLPSKDQVNASGDKDGPSQKSHVFSIDADYDLNSHFTLGGKYGYRQSLVAQRGTQDYKSNTAHLGIARLNWHVVNNWDVMSDGRLMYSEEDETLSFGAVLGVYRHITKNLKIGIGYEWGHVSEDMTELDYRSQGIFANMIVKM
ncbi:hypothetical protein [Polycladidibacter stylochi]|uniref:hypothetical protein n=1 Tax=Polycladidibacter stylochi TaxID=1807766 RepID=UPI00082E014A|nr:hypothetical protein [Pseudovibrio stylochi]